MVNTNILFLRVSKHMKHKLIKMEGEIDRCKIIVGDVNTPLSVIDRIENKREPKHYNQLDLIDIYRTLHPTTGQYTFFSRYMECSPRQMISRVMK